MDSTCLSPLYVGLIFIIAYIASKFQDLRVFDLVLLILSMLVLFVLTNRITKKRYEQFTNVYNPVQETFYEDGLDAVDAGQEPTPISVSSSTPASTSSDPVVPVLNLATPTPTPTPTPNPSPVPLPSSTPEASTTSSTQVITQQLLTTIRTDTRGTNTGNSSYSVQVKQVMAMNDEMKRYPPFFTAYEYGLQQYYSVWEKKSYIPGNTVMMNILNPVNNITFTTDTYQYDDSTNSIHVFNRVLGNMQCDSLFENKDVTSFTVSTFIKLVSIRSSSTTNTFVTLLNFKVNNNLALRFSIKIEPSTNAESTSKVIVKLELDDETGRPPTSIQQQINSSPLDTTMFIDGRFHLLTITRSQQGSHTVFYDATRIINGEPYTPSNGRVFKLSNLTYVPFNDQRTSAQTDMVDFYLQSLMLFNRVLTDQQIRDIYEHFKYNNEMLSIAWKDIYNIYAATDMKIDDYTMCPFSGDETSKSNLCFTAPCSNIKDWTDFDAVFSDENDICLSRLSTYCKSNPSKFCALVNPKNALKVLKLSNKTDYDTLIKVKTSGSSSFNSASVDNIVLDKTYRTMDGIDNLLNKINVNTIIPHGINNVLQNIDYVNMENTAQSIANVTKVTDKGALSGSATQNVNVITGGLLQSSPNPSTSTSLTTNVSASSGNVWDGSISERYGLQQNGYKNMNDDQYEQIVSEFQKKSVTPTEEQKGVFNSFVHYLSGLFK